MGHLVQREHPQNWGKIGVGSHGDAQKTAISPKWCKIEPRLLLRTNRKSHARFLLIPKSVTLNNLEQRIQGLPKVLNYPLLSQERIKLRTSNLACSFSYKSPLKILQKRERGRIQGLPKIFKYPLISQERVKLRTSNLAGTLTGSIQTKAH